MPKKISLLISITLCIMVALLVWVAGNSSTLPPSNNQESVVELSLLNDKKDPTEQQKTDTKGSTVQPQSAETLQTLISEENDQQTLGDNAKTLEEKISQLDETLLKLDQQLTDKGIDQQIQKTDLIETDESSQQQRLKAIKEHLYKVQ